MKLPLAFLALSLCLHAQEANRHRALYWTAAAAVATTLADASISQHFISRGGCCETSRLISPTGHTFGARGFAIDLLPVAALVIPQHWVVNKWPKTESWYAGWNIALASWFGIAAAKDAVYASSR